MQKILIVEDDIDIQDILKNHLIDLVSLYLILRAFPYPVYPDTGFPYLVKPYLVQPYPAQAFLAAGAGVAHKSHTRCR